MDARGEMAVAMTEDVQVPAKPRRRTYTTEYKRRILKEADACTTPGAIGALLRREGLYSSHLVVWRRARGRGELAAVRPKKRGISASFRARGCRTQLTQRPVSASPIPSIRSVTRLVAGSYRATR